MAVLCAKRTYTTGMSCSISLANIVCLPYEFCPCISEITFFGKLTISHRKLTLTNKISNIQKRQLMIFMTNLFTSFTDNIFLTKFSIHRHTGATSVCSTIHRCKTFLRHCTKLIMIRLIELYEMYRARKFDIELFF